MAVGMEVLLFETGYHEICDTIHWNRSKAFGSDFSYYEGAGMLGDITAADEIYIVTGRTDMRKSVWTMKTLLFL